MKRPFVLLALMLCGLPSFLRAGTTSDTSPLDRALQAHTAGLKTSRLTPPPAQPAAKVRLGQMLFFDKILAGNRDTACATCHHPSLMSGDALCLSLGTGGSGLGPMRIKGFDRPFVARNATELFNRGSTEWDTMFWDFRVSGVPGQFKSPAGASLPPGLESVLAVQAMFPVTGRDEMRGMAGDPGNDVARLADSDFRGIWAALTARIMAIPAYRVMFAQAYPNVAASQVGFQHAANAIAAFESVAFVAADTPWDRYLAGDPHALSPAAKRGALLFYGKAGCVRCHSGSLLTDQRPHNIAVPQLGPGKPPHDPLDIGCGQTSGKLSDRFTFRTPPLRNVAVTGPWMHNGAYTTLSAAVQHHLHAVYALQTYDRSQLPVYLQSTVLGDPATVHDVLSTLDPLMRRPVGLKPHEFNDLITFLYALTSPSIGRLNNLIPPAVPSGLPVDRFGP